MECKDFEPSIIQDKDNNLYINIKDIAEAKGLTSTRSIRLEINKPESKYISREVKVNGGTSYEILFSSLEPDLQDKLRNNEKKSTSLVPLNYQPPQFVSDNAKMVANFRINIVLALIKFRKNYQTKKQADSDFLDAYNSGLLLPKAHRFIGSISIGTLHRWLKKYEQHENAECLQPQYKYNKQGEYNSILNDEMKYILLTLLLHPSQYNYGKAYKLTKEILRKRGYTEFPCYLTFKRFAENFRKNNYAEWILRREGMKAYHDKVEPYIERDIDKIEVGDVIVADGHVLNFQVINPFTGKPTRATLVGFLDWKSTALVGYEIMMTESTQCIASALRNAILNLGVIPKVVYQDNGKGFKAKFFQNTDFEEEQFNGVYANLNIYSVFAKPYNARAKVIERFFLEFQEELEKGMPSYIGTSIETKPAWLKRGEALLELAKRGENLRPLMKAIAGIFASSTEENFKNEGRPEKWTDLSDITKKSREKINKWPGQILTVEGQLASSVTTQYDDNSAVIGSNKEYARIHQLGGKAGRNKSVNIPARPYLFLTDDDFDEILHETKKYLKEN